MRQELERKLLQKRYRRIRAFKKVQAAIERLESEQEKDLLTYRYLKGYSWEKIAVEMGYTYRHVTRLHGEALTNFKMS